MENRKTFEKLFIWEESKNLFKTLYKRFSSINSRDYFYRDQLLRATLSISNNIAECHERKTSKELINFLNFAKASAWETRNMIIIAIEHWFINNNEYEEYIQSLMRISAWIQNLIKLKNPN